MSQIKSVLILGKVVSRWSKWVKAGLNPGKSRLKVV